MKIIIHRGTHEIGGSCVEIQNKKSRILIDIGMLFWWRRRGRVFGCLKDYTEIPYPSKAYPNIKVFFPYWLCRRITQEGREELMYRYKNYKITRKEISEFILFILINTRICFTGR